MRILWIGGVGAVALALVTAAPASADRHRCAVRATTTIEQTKSIRVYRRGDAAEHRVYACYQRTGRRRLLGEFDLSEGPGIIAPTIAGRFVAYQFLDCERGDDCANSEVRVMDVRTGRVRRSAKAGAGAFRLEGIVVKRNGSVAWIRAFLDRTSQVRKIDAAGEALLDSGNNIEAFSLALSAASTRLYWVKDGAPVSVAFN